MHVKLLFKQAAKVTLLSFSLALSISASSSEKEVIYPELRDELLEMRDREQSIRFRFIEAENDVSSEKLIEEMKKVDAHNLSRLKEMIGKYGWLNTTLVGRDGIAAAFLIIQHADDLAFQKKMLPHIKKSYKADELFGEKYALLLDRILVTEGKLQIYGTQVEPQEKWVDGRAVACPIENPDQVDIRRAELGMQPLTDYLISIEEIYAPN